MVGECRGRGYGGAEAGPGSARARLCTRGGSAAGACRQRLLIYDKSAKLYSKYSWFFLILCLIRSNMCFILKIKEKGLNWNKSKN